MCGFFLSVSRSHSSRQRLQLQIKNEKLTIQSGCGGFGAKHKESFMEASALLVGWRDMVS